VPFCPECALEYDVTVQVCPECQVGLVKQLPGVIGSAAMSPDDSWVRVCQVGEDLTSQLVRGLLDTNNIPSITMSSAFHPLGSGLGWVAGLRSEEDKVYYLMVPREFQHDVELLLASLLGRDFVDRDAQKP
jgi:hypothetical protein